MVTVGNFSTLLQLANYDARMYLDSIGEVQDSGARKVRPDSVCKQLQLILRNEPFRCPLIRALLTLGHASLCVVAHELRVQTTFAFYNVRELMHEGKPEPIHSVIPK